MRSPRAPRLAARGESLALHRDGRGAPVARRDDREYREYLREEQRSQRGCIAGRMQLDFHHGLLKLMRAQRSHRLSGSFRVDLSIEKRHAIGLQDFADLSVLSADRLLHLGSQRVITMSDAHGDVEGE